jgi:hypothetical protein
MIISLETALLLVQKEGDFEIIAEKGASKEFGVSPIEIELKKGYCMKKVSENLRIKKGIESNQTITIYGKIDRISDYSINLKNDAYIFDIPYKAISKMTIKSFNKNIKSGQSG